MTDDTSDAGATRPEPVPKSRLKLLVTILLLLFVGPLILAAVTGILLMAFGK